MKLIRVPYWQLLLGPSFLFSLGFLLNALAIVSNKGQMPVFYPGGITTGYENSQDVVHVGMTAHTHLKFLSDWILINGLGLASPGDFLEWAAQYGWSYSLVSWLTLILKDRQSGR